jgi:two-component system sensor histidine kinase DesK
MSLAGEIRTATGLLGAAGVAATAGGAPVGLPPAVEAVAAWVVREASTNVVRHARASRCGIVLGRDAGTVLVEVRDDGVGSRAAGPPVRGNGLTGLAERVEALGGTLTAGPLDGWFTVRASVPEHGRPKPVADPLAVPEPAA